MLPTSLGQAMLLISSRVFTNSHIHGDHPHSTYAEFPSTFVRKRILFALPPPLLCPASNYATLVWFRTPWPNTTLDELAVFLFVKYDDALFIQGDDVALQYL